jgi:hypothetical protein
MSSLLSALGYPDLTTAQTAWTANPQLHGWENGPTLMLAGYGVTIPALSDLTTVSAFTSGVATTGQFIGTHDGSTITATGLPTCMTIFSDGRGWSEDGTCATGTVTSTITETNGANVHNTTLTWTIGAQPVLSGLSVTPGSTSATVNVSSNTGSGTIFAEAVSTSTAPSWPQVRGGLDSNDGLNVSALWPHASQSVTATGAQPAMSITGLTASTAYYLQIAQLDANNNPSVTSTYAFTTEATGVATLTSPSGTATGSSSATLSVSTDTASGTLYDIASTSSTAPSVAQIQAGDDSSGSLSAYHTSQTVTATGTQTSSATGLTASTTYYPYFQQHTTAGDSVVVAGASFTTSSGTAWDTTALAAADYTFTNSNLTAQATVSANNEIIRGSAAKSSGSATFTINLSGSNTTPALVGLVSPAVVNGNAFLGQSVNSIAYAGDGHIYKGGAALASGLATFTAGDVITVSYSGGIATFQKNGTTVYTSSDISSDLPTAYPAMSVNTGNTDGRAWKITLGGW